MGLVSFMRTQLRNGNFAFCFRIKCNYFHKWRSQTAFHLQCSICVIGPHCDWKLLWDERANKTQSMKMNMVCFFTENSIWLHFALFYTMSYYYSKSSRIEIKPGQFQCFSPFSRLKWNVNLIARGGPTKCVNISMFVIYFTVQFRSHDTHVSINSQL